MRDRDKRLAREYVARLLAEDDDERAAAAYAEWSRGAVIAAWAGAEAVGSRQDRAGYYSYTDYRLADPGVPLDRVRSILFDRFADAAGSLIGSAAGGYSTLGHVRADDGSIVVESVYHHGD